MWNRDRKAWGGWFGNGRKRFGDSDNQLLTGRVLSSDELQLVILLLLSKKPSHGYEIIKVLTEKSNGFYTPSPGMIYPALTYLEEVSYIIFEIVGTKKLASITPEGKAHLEQNLEKTEATFENLSRYGQKMSYFQEQINEEREAEEKWTGSEKDREKKEWHQMKTEFRDIRRDLKMVIFEKMYASLEERKRVFQILRKTIQEIRG